jgi:ATP-dependent RNA helicase RhlE
MKQTACWTWVLRDIERILKVLPTKDKTYCFQQPFQRHQEIGHGHFITVHVEATPKNTTVDAIIKKYILSPREKTELIIKLITEGNWKQILVSPVPNKALIN